MREKNNEEIVNYCDCVLVKLNSIVSFSQRNYKYEYVCIPRFIDYYSTRRINFYKFWGSVFDRI